jgi:hypothetical protein
MCISGHVSIHAPARGATTVYLFAGDEPIGVRFNRTSGPVMRYYVGDHLGSISVITDEAGAVAERLSYDAWGKRRF